MADVRTLEEWDALFRNPQPRHLKLYFSDGTILENDRIVQESLLLEEALCSEENLRYGSCEAGCLRLRIVAEPLPPEQYIIDSDNNRIITDDGEIFMDGTDYSMTIDKSFEGLYVNVIMQFDEQTGVIVTDQGEHFVTSDGEEISYSDIPAAHFGNYRVVSDTPTSDRVYRDLICYDKMYDILNANVVDWYNSLTFPISIKDMRDSFFEYLGVPQIETELINDDYEVNGKFKADYDMSGKSIIESICELNGVFGHITRYGEFEYISLPTQDSLEYPYYKNGTSKYEDYLTSNITQISLASDSDDSSIVVGTSGNTYYMQANPLTYEMDEDASLMYALNNLLDLISQFSYRPFETTTYGNPMLPIGTNVTFNTRYKPIESFVMARSLSGIQSLKDKFMAKGQRVYPKDTNNSANQLTRAKNTSSQQAQTIVLKVDENGNMVAVKLGESASRGSFFDLNADNIKFVANSTLNMKAAQLNVESDNVAITPDGFITATGANISGVISSQQGNIGGWLINENGLYKRIDDETTGLYRVCMITPGEVSLQASDWVDNVSSYLTHRLLYFLYNNSDGTVDTTLALDGSARDSIVLETPYDLAINSLNYTGSLNHVSSIEVKENVKDMSKDEAERILKLNPVSFDYIEGDKDCRGFIAEEVEKVLPNLVAEGYGKKGDKFHYRPKSLDYVSMIPYMVKVLQMQEDRIAKLENEIASLKNNKEDK